MKADADPDFDAGPDRHAAPAAGASGAAARAGAESTAVVTKLPAPPLSLVAMLYYGMFGLPLAMLALPIYVYVPQFYAQRGALTLAVIGAALLAARTAAAFIDPLLGWWIARAGGAYRRFVLIALPPLMVGYTALFHPPALSGLPALCWFLASLMLVYTGFSLATIAHQSWGAALTQRRGERGSLAAVRESCGLLGVMTAAVLPTLSGYDALSYAFALTLLASAACLLWKAPRPPRPASGMEPRGAASRPGADGIDLSGDAASRRPRADGVDLSGNAASRRPAADGIDPPGDAASPWPGADGVDLPGDVPSRRPRQGGTDHGWKAVAARRLAELSAPFRQRPFRALFLVLMVNGVAAAIPATLFLFFAEDRLRLGANAGLLLLVYFASAAASMAAWPALARRLGEARAWAASMLVTAAVFVWAYWLGPGDVLSFGVICAISGLALGADLALPPALLAGVIAKAGDSGSGEAAYFGVWNWGVQMTLALAAGVALPALEWLGYVPGTGHGLGALSFAYALLPCCLKLVAAALLWRAPLRDI